MKSSINVAMLLNFFLLMAATPIIHGLNSTKLDDTTVPGPTDEKCTPCNPTPPPPPPPPPAPKKPPSSYCPPPPPPPSFVYITGPPGDLYPIDSYFSGGAKAAVALPVLIGCGLLGLLVRFGL